ncbi:MAG: hypothetical protein M1829_005878 [Trizodia sp. TS-e1964]|nr:MAG: hypothetical protein M1829_005878 [Trizodia sp. TS-e1964]
MADSELPNAADGRPTIPDLYGESYFAQFAKKSWLHPTGSNSLKQEQLKTEIWDVLEKEGFSFRSLALLENLQFLEKCLWPLYSDSSTNFHVLLIILIGNVKTRERIRLWDHFSEKSHDFASLFRRVLSLSLDQSLSTVVHTHILTFIINSFSSLDCGIVRKECAPLVSVSIWHHLHSDLSRERIFEEHQQVRKAWRAAGKRYEAADDATKTKLRFERSWLVTMISDFIRRIHIATNNQSGNTIYCERFLEMLIDLESQLPTRRYVNTLLRDYNILAIIKTSLAYNDQENELFRDLFNLLRHFVYFPIHDYSGIPFTRPESSEAHYTALSRLQRISLKHFKAKLTILALSNYGSIEKRSDLENHFSSLSDTELKELCEYLGFKTSYPSLTSLVVDRNFLLEVLLLAHERRKPFQEVVKDLSILPTEVSLFEPSLLRNEVYNGSRPLAIPKLNLQYLSVGDFLWRSFILHRCESFFEIRKDIEDTITRIRPKIKQSTEGTKFEGFTKMALPISKTLILEVVPPRVGSDHPALVRAEVSFDISRLPEGILKGWDSLRPDDVVFLIAANPLDISETTESRIDEGNVAERLGLKFLRSAEVIQISDENGRPIRDFQDSRVDGQRNHSKGRIRRLQLKLDASNYKMDSELPKIKNRSVYESMNLIMRRKGRENNFKPVLQSIQSLTLSDVPMPSWLQGAFLGSGDPSKASYPNISSRIKSIDFCDTFLDWQHLIESFPGKSIGPPSNGPKSFEPPYVLKIDLADETQNNQRQLKKRRRDQIEPTKAPKETLVVSTYKIPNTGPYPTDTPNTNKIRFTPMQIEAILSGAQPGLTVIAGPPGTGKTDVATQIISNLYHNFPKQRILLIAHSNQALNQLFQKIIALDIDKRHLLRLGHGEEDLDSNSSWSKYGRVDSFLENRAQYLSEVDKLAANLSAPGAHGSSCETAGYFRSVYFQPAWLRFLDISNSSEATVDTITSAFPFHSYFSDAPQPIFPPGISEQEAKEIANGCYRHIDKIFSELENIQPFEILRTARDKANYLLVKEARVVAMTSTHAAMRRQEIANLGFHYENIVVEEAAQITEIENFIPLALQHPKEGELPLQRVILCGDHLQNSPIVQNLAFCQYANLEQSLFSRLVRLGVPVINLNKQGRARPSIADLYRWRYTGLGDLPQVESDAEFQRANAGFRYEYQFIEVDDYKGSGEREPTPHFIQNLGEAEYAVAIYQYMRLLGYPSSKISILTTYVGQQSLINDVLNHRCSQNSLFGMPKTCATVDKYQGEQNDYIILSLTRTNRVGYLRDIRRLTVALSRARLGLYILGRRNVFESCFELKAAFDILLKRPDKLQVTTREMFPTTRIFNDKVESTEIDGVEHLGQYVFEMTQAKVASLETRQNERDQVPEAEKMDANMSDNDSGEA